MKRKNDFSLTKNAPEPTPGPKKGLFWRGSQLQEYPAARNGKFVRFDESLPLVLELKKKSLLSNSDLLLKSETPAM